MHYKTLRIIHEALEQRLDILQDRKCILNMKEDMSEDEKEELKELFIECAEVNNAIMDFDANEWH